MSCPLAYTSLHTSEVSDWTCLCRKADAAKLEIAEARTEIMAPLSAASMESYSRAYPYLVKLHMLQV